MAEPDADVSIGTEAAAECRACASSSPAEREVPAGEEEAWVERIADAVMRRLDEQRKVELIAEYVLARIREEQAKPEAETTEEGVQ